MFCPGSAQGRARNTFHVVWCTTILALTLLSICTVDPTLLHSCAATPRQVLHPEVHLGAT